MGTDAAETLSLAWDDTDGLRSVRSSRGEASASHVGDYARDRGGRTERAGERVRGHDAAGFLVGHGAMTLAWDHLGRLSSAVDETRSEVVAYGFEGTRVASLGEGGLVLYVDPDVEIRDGLASVYARIGASRVARVRSTQLATELVADLDADGAIDVRDAWLARGGADELALRAAARRLLHDAAPEPTQLYADALGSLIAATREGEIVGRRALSPLGAVRRERGFVDAHAFTGQELDAATGLYVFDHRLLDPSAGLWTSADPAFEAVSSELDRAPEMANRYAYVLGQVTSSVDPDGLMRDRARGRARRAGAWLRSRRRLVRVGQNVAVWGAQGFMYLGLSNTTSQGVRIGSGLGGTLAVIGTAATRTYLRYRDLNQRARGMTQHVLRAVRDTFSDVTVGGITSLGLSMVTQLGSSSGLTSEYFASTGFLSLVGGTVVGALGWLGTELAANARSDASLSTEEGASEVGSGPVDLSDVQVEQ